MCSRKRIKSTKERSTPRRRKRNDDGIIPLEKKEAFSSLWRLLLLLLLARTLGRRRRRRRTVVVVVLRPPWPRLPIFVDSIPRLITRDLLRLLLLCGDFANCLSSNRKKDGIDLKLFGKWQRASNEHKRILLCRIHPHDTTKKYEKEEKKQKRREEKVLCTIGNLFPTGCQAKKKSPTFSPSPINNGNEDNRLFFSAIHFINTCSIDSVFLYIFSPLLAFVLVLLPGKEGLRYIIRPIR